MDRQIVYVGQIPQDTDLLLTNKNMMVALGYLMQAVLGTSTLVDGLACTPTGPASLTVNVAGGSIYSLAQIDPTAYGSIAADTADQIVKQGIVIATQNFSCPAPGTPGQSVVYLVEAQYQDVDTGSTTLPYYNASNPSMAYSGPNNTGVSQNTIRQGLCKVQVKTGVAATTGTQVTPSPDAGFTGLFAITVANGQSTITSGNIVQLSTAPFINPKLPNILASLQSGAAIYAADTSVTANTITVAFSPALTSLVAGQPMRIKVANTNTGPVVINPNGLGNTTTTREDGSAIPAGTLQANGVYTFIYDGSHIQLQSPSVRQALTANTTWFVATTGSDSNNGLSSGAPFLTIQHAINVIANTIDLNGFTATIQVADGTYTGAVSVMAPFTGAGSVVLQGNTTTPANCIISTTSANCLTAQNSAVISIQGFKLQTATSGYCMLAQYNAQVNVTGNMNYGSAANIHLGTQDGAQIVVTANYTISGGAANHWNAGRSCRVLCTGLTITISGTPAFSAQFAASGLLGVIQCDSNTFSGSATGTRYTATTNAIINTGGGGSTYLPGNAAGSVANGGLYL